MGSLASTSVQNDSNSWFGRAADFVLHTLIVYYCAMHLFPMVGVSLVRLDRTCTSNLDQRSGNRLVIATFRVGYDSSGFGCWLPRCGSIPSRHSSPLHAWPPSGGQGLEVKQALSTSGRRTRMFLTSPLIDQAITPTNNSTRGIGPR